MTKYYTTDTELKSIADAIREKGDTSAALTYPSGFVSAIQNLPSGGGGTDGDVIFIDYDGSVVATKTKAEINAMTSDSELPENPTHTGLTAQGWNWTVAQLKAQLLAMPNDPVTVGQMYITSSGKTEIDVEMKAGRLSPILTIAVNGTVTVDWGDGTTPDTVTGTSETTRLAVGPHNYASAGNYTISISKVSGTYLFNGSSQYTLLRKNATTAENRVYSSCVKAIRIGNGITSLKSAFYYCQSLTSITIPNSITNIENGLEYCYSLKSITIPSSMTSIEDYVFYYGYSLTSVSIPYSVTSIEGYVFNNCRSLASITIPNSVTSIGGYVFYNCAALTSITIPNSVTSIGNYVFYGCTSLASITIPNSVTSIGSHMFEGCNSLKNIMFPSGMTIFFGYTFYGCNSLESITIPNGVTKIEDDAFYGCYSLKSITIPSGVTSIGDSVFYNCYALASITIPSNVTSIGNSTFYACRGVKEYHIKPTTVPTLGTSAFYNIPSDCVIYVPRGKLSDYQTASNWSAYASYMQEEPAA